MLNLMLPMANDREFEHKVHDLKENLRLATDVEKVQPRKGLDKLLGIDAMCDSGPLHSAAGQSCPISVNATRSNYEQELQLARSWLRKEFDLKCDLGLALQADFYVISYGVQSSRYLSTWVNQTASLLLHVGTEIRFPIGHTLYGLFRQLVMIAQDMLLIHANERELSNLT